MRKYFSGKWKKRVPNAIFSYFQTSECVNIYFEVKNDALAAAN